MSRLRVILLLSVLSPLDALSSSSSSPSSSSPQRRYGWTRNNSQDALTETVTTIPIRHLRQQSAARRANLFRLKMSSSLNNNKDDENNSERKYGPINGDEEDDDVDDDDERFFGNSNDEEEDSMKRKRIEITSQIELPFSAEVAYDAYTNLSRQSSWSSWLESVVVLNDNNDGDKVESRWTSKMMGIRYSWTAVAVKNIRPHTIQWRSTTGLQNEGIVRFYQKEGNAGSHDKGPTTLMTLKMVFVAPRAVSSIIRRSKKLSNYVEEKMIAQSLKEFRDTVLENDVKNANTIQIESAASESSTKNRIR